MAFCNSCGTSITSGTRFCSKCGAPILASTIPSASTSAPSTPSTVPVPPGTTLPGSAAQSSAQGGGALKVILIVVGVIVLLGILGFASLGYFAWRVAHRVHARQDGNNVKIDTPFGSVQTTQDPADAAKNLGVELYPGADVEKGGSSSATFGAVHTATVKAESTDSVDKIASFYKAKFPNAMVTSSDAGRCTIISNDHHSMITINIESEDGKSKILITNVTRKSGMSDSSNSSSN